MSLTQFLNKKIVVTQVKSGSKFTEKQKGSLIGLGLRGVHTSAQLTCSPAVLGMIKKVNHVVKVALA
jgi:large subunit ribosomal protein L30